jgi:hypothetical protein
LIFHDSLSNGDSSDDFSLPRRNPG